MTNIIDFWENIKYIKICIIGFSKNDLLFSKADFLKDLFEKIMIKNVSNL